MFLNSNVACFQRELVGKESQKEFNVQLIMASKQKRNKKKLLHAHEWLKLCGIEERMSIFAIKDQEKLCSLLKMWHLASGKSGFYCVAQRKEVKESRTSNRIKKMKIEPSFRFIPYSGEKKR